MKKQRRRTQVTPRCFRKMDSVTMKKFGIQRIHRSRRCMMTDRQKREECCRQSGSCGSGKPSNPSHQHAPLGTIHCGFAKNLPDFRSPNTIVFYFRLFKERLRIRNIAWTKLTIFPDMKVMCPKVLFLEPYFGFRVIRLGRHRLIFFRTPLVFYALC